MRARSAAILLGSLAACAGPASTRTDAPASPAASAFPESDPSDLLTPRATTLLPPTGEVAVRVQRGPAGRPVIMELLSAGLTDADRVRLQAALEAGRLRLASEGTKGETTWTTTLRPSQPQPQ